MGHSNISLLSSSTVRFYVHLGKSLTGNRTSHFACLLSWFWFNLAQRLRTKRQGQRRSWSRSRVNTYKIETPGVMWYPLTFMTYPSQTEGKHVLMCLDISPTKEKTLLPTEWNLGVHEGAGGEVVVELLYWWSVSSAWPRPWRP